MSVAVAYVNWGRWVARCPRCPSAEQAGRGLTTDRFVCSACDLACAVSWPPNVDDIWRLLAARPDPSTRNWLPGETIHDLLIENLAHGILPDLPDSLPAAGAVPLLTLAGDRIAAGHQLLPALPTPAIEGVR